MRAGATLWAIATCPEELLPMGVLGGEVGSGEGTRKGAVTALKEDYSQLYLL